MFELLFEELWVGEEGVGTGDTACTPAAEYKKIDSREDIAETC